MRNRLIFTVLFSLLSIVAVAQEAPKHQFAEGLIARNNIFYTGLKEGVSCYRIPALVTAPNGDLIASIDERVPHCGDLIYSEDINIIVRRSGDGGKTWGDVEVAVDFEQGQSASDPSFILDEESGEIFLFYNYMDLVNEPKVFYLHYVKSSDNGKSWSKPVDITSQIAKEEWHGDFKFITSGRGIYTSTGKMLHTLVNLKNGLHIFGSDDHGANWYLIDTAITPADESKIVELSDGRWMINSRVNGGYGMRCIHISEDEGQSWETHNDPMLVDPSCNASILNYSSVREGYDKNRLIFSNASSAKGRENLTVRVSYDDGQTWPIEKVIYPGSTAYSDIVKLDNGDLALFFERDSHTANDVLIFSLEWLTDGKDKYKKPRRAKRRK
ncbi:MAG: sialidase family protein [Rikenellaceae bacterium]